MYSKVFSISGLLLFASCLILNIIILRSRRTKLLGLWALFNFSVGFWGFFAFLIGQATSLNCVNILWRLAHVGIVFIAVFVFHTMLLFCNIQKKGILRFAYAQAFFFSFLSLFGSPLFMKNIRLFYGIWYMRGGWLYYVFFGIWVWLVGYSHYLLFSVYKKSQGARRIQIKYFFFGILFGFSGGITNFLPVVGISIFPFGNFTIPIYCLIVTYAILKYRLLDITTAVTRTSIFIFVYSLVLGIPFAMALGWKQSLVSWLGDWWWFAPLISSTLLATGGPFIYLFIQKKTENRLLRDQKRYQATLKQASSGMTRIKDLKRLLNLIVYILSRSINLDHVCMYLYDFSKREYLLKASREKSSDNFDASIQKHSAFIRYLEKVNAPIVYEEIKQRMHDYGGQEYKEVEEKLRSLKAEVVVPIFTEKQLIAIGVLGKKKTREMYSQDDLAVFTILANQVALAIENAQFYEESKKTQAQLFQAEKMATIGTMADGLSHQINNRLHALGFIAGDALDSVKLKAEAANHSSEEIKELLLDVTGALIKIQENVRQGGEIVQGLLRYTRKGEEGFGEVDFCKLIDASVEMTQFKIKKDQLVITKDYGSDVAPIYGNFTQLQEVMFNIIDNAYDAAMQRKSEKKEPNYKAKIKISTRQVAGLLEISVLDNGIGVREEDQNKLFTPFFTTKFSSKKGTGLGLYVIRKIVEDNHNGKVFMSSEYMTGTLTVLKLPIFRK